MLADEPTGQLDSHTSADIMGILQRLNREHGITIVVVTHSDEVASFANRTITFRDGRVVSDSKYPSPDLPSELLAGLHEPVEISP